MNNPFKYLDDKLKQHEHVSYKKLKEYTWNYDINFYNLDNIVTDDILTPLVIRKFYSSTSACQTWNINNIGKFFHNALFNVECYENIEKYYIGDKNQKKDGKSKTTISNYAKYLKTNTTKPFYYLAEIDIKEKINNHETPTQLPMYIFNPNMKPFHHNIDSELIFFGNNAASNCHIHVEDNYFLNQVFGSKTIYLFEYDDSNHLVTKHCESLYKNLGIEHCSSINFIKENFFDLDHSKFNNLYKVTLNPGDTLIIPPHWWHATKGHGINCSITTIVTRTDLSYYFKPRFRPGLILAHLTNSFDYSDTLLGFLDDFVENHYFHLYFLLSSFYIYFSKTKS